MWLSGSERACTPLNGTKHLVQKAIGSGAILASLLLATTVTGALIGCSDNNARELNSAPMAKQEQAQKTVELFMSDLQRSDWTSAHGLLAAPLQGKMPVEKFEATIRGPEKPVLGAVKWKYYGSTYDGRRNKVMLHIEFSSAGAAYRMNVSLIQSGSSWAIDSLYPPNKTGWAVAAIGHLSKMPSKPGGN